MIEIVLCILGGIGLGVITGLLPGIHINLVASILIPLLLAENSLAPFALAAGVVALAATHTILDFIPSVYLGAPEEETALSVLPAHKLLQQGHGHAAVLLVIMGALCGLIAATITFPLLIIGAPFLETRIQPMLPFLLIGIASFMIAREKTPLRALVTFVLAGFLGYAALNLPIREPLFPLLSGLFGLSGLILALKEKTKIPAQHNEGFNNIIPLKKDMMGAVRDTITTGLPCAILPALGSGYAAFIAAEMTNPSIKRFLMVTSALNVYVMAASFILVAIIGKARTGASAEVGVLLGEITLTQIVSLFAVFVATTLVAGKIAEAISKKAAEKIGNLSYAKITWGAGFFIIGIVAFISGPEGILVLMTGTALGVYTLTSHVKRMHLMGCLILPTIIYYLR